MFNKIVFFFNNLFGTLRDAPNAHSLNKIVSVAITVVYSYSSVLYTTKDNLVMVLGVHAGLITAMLVSHKYFKGKDGNAQSSGGNS